MRKRWLGILALALAVLPLAAARTGEAAPPEPPSEFVVVQFASRMAPLTSADEPPTLAEQGYVQLPVPKGKTAAQYATELRAKPDVLYAEPDAPVYAADVPNDPFYREHQAQYLEQIGAPQAWDLATGSKDIVVAVLDSGLDLSHPEFAGRLWENPADAYNDGVDHDGNGCINDRYGCRFVTYKVANRDACGYTSNTATGAVMDDDGPPRSGYGSHGTFVSGIIGAAGNNNQGVAGVAWNVKLMTVKVLDCGSGAGGVPQGDMFDVARGIEYATKMGANIINLSIASPPGDLSGDTPTLRSAIQRAQDAGVIIVAAAGNHQPGATRVGTGYPAAYTDYPNLIAVGASDNLNGNTWAPYSNYGPAIDFAAPGNKISSTLRSDIGLATPYGEVGDATDGYSGGTSFATPLVSGMFALMMSRNPHLTAADYIQVARDSAMPAAPAPHGQNWAGSGIINIGQAVARLPMSITGSALKDWKDVPAGTDIRALIDGNECGSAASTSFGVVSRYSIQVKSRLQQQDCGSPGKTVQLTIAGQPAFPTFTWGGKDEDIGLENRDVSSISPPPGAVVVQTLNGAWSNIASFEATGPAESVFSSLPTPWSGAYHWDPAKPSLDSSPGAYVHYFRDVPAAVNDWNIVQQYDSFWVNGPAANLASINPSPPAGRVLPLRPGWNNFVYTGTSKQVSDALKEISGKYSEVLQYDNASQRWLVNIPGQRRYLQDFGGLFKLKVYWIYMTDAGAITMN